MRLSEFAAAVFFCCASAAAAQSPMRGLSGEETEQLAEESMRSRSYSQDTSMNWDARLKPVSGSVSVKARDSEEWSEVTEELPVDSADQIKTGSDGAAELYLDDKGVFYIDRNTELEVASIGQPDMSISLRFGALAAKINKFLNSKFKMEVRTPTAVCAVRGTEFAVEYSRLSKDTGVAVYDEGRLAVTPLDESGNQGQEQALEKNSELTLAAEQKRFHAGPVSRMMKHRGRVSALRAAVQARRKSWRRVSSDQRSEMRQRALKRKVLRRQLGKAPSTAAPKKAQGAAKKNRAIKARRAKKIAR